MKFPESHIEDPALSWLAGFGYASLHGPGTSLDGPTLERISYNQVLLTKRHGEALEHLARRKDPSKGSRDCRGDVLFSDAYKLGHSVDQTRKKFSDEDIANTPGSYNVWRDEPAADSYEDELGFYNAATQDEFRTHNYIVRLGRYVGAEAEGYEVAFEERFAELNESLVEQFAEAEELGAPIQVKL